MPVVLDLEHLCFDRCDLDQVESRAQYRREVADMQEAETGVRPLGSRVQRFLRYSEDPVKPYKQTEARPVADPDRYPQSSGLEARVREMNSAMAVAACEKNNLTFKREAPNPGVLGMRAKNALYAAIRRGVELKL